MTHDMNSRRILLVEDDEGLRMVAQLTLETLGSYEVLALESGAAAVAQAAGFDPALVLLDVSMPGLDGPATLAQLRQQASLRDTPVIFLTANTQAGQVAAYRALGAVDVVAKPFEPDELVRRVEAALVQAAAPAPAAAPRVREALVVEDDPGIRFLLRFMLEQHGWQVREASTGTEGQQALRGPLPHAVVLDIMLPGIDGLALLAQLRAQRRWEDVPVMMLTAKGDEPSVQRALAAGADDYLAKPFDPQELASRMERLRRLRASSPGPGG
ncbi:response regulator transcription factor [Ramlibacter aquaticus]|nr:response regulator [Ramlibacter aquaticus]